ncbi:hypothetical protein EYC84_007648 [Monilinia fructicola]|uniref:Uncharacterized protein n=1 Tax=Monilinia fructicola TaxID=38448 RepID=A0A5M9JIT6_MONFR|nr:hypothetical protein EYC84_007648 [Monilinia fructicola]
MQPFPTYIFLIHTIHFKPMQHTRISCCPFFIVPSTPSISSTTSTLNLTGRPTTHFPITSPPSVHPSIHRHSTIRTCYAL